MGKTTLARAVAERAHGAVWVDLAPVMDREGVVAAFMRALGVDDLGGRTPAEALRAALTGRQVQLFVDNAEHVVAAVSEILVPLVRDARRLGVLVTSREALKVAGESRFVVTPLDEPAAVALLVLRAGAVAAEDMPAVARICRGLDGIPLAIEFAAAQVRSSSVAEVEASLGRVLEFGVDAAAARPRHMTLRAALSWSHDLLDEPERVLIRRLSVFAGSFALDSVEAVCDGDEATLRRLVDRSLVTAQPGDSRYRLLETVRQFASDQIDRAGERAVIEARCTAFFVALAETAETKVRGPEQLEWHRRLRADYDNIVAVLQRGLSASGGLSDDGARIAGALAWWWVQYDFRGSEAMRWLKRATAQLDDPDSRAPMAKAALYSALDEWIRGDLPGASAIALAALPLLEGVDPWHAATARMMSDLSPISAGLEVREAWFADCIETYRRVGDDGFGEWLTQFARAMLATAMGDVDVRRDANERRLEVGRRMGDLAGTLQPLTGLAAVALIEGDHERAAAVLGQVIALAQTLEAGSLTGVVLGTTAWLAATRAEWEIAARLFGALDGFSERSGAQLNFVARAEFDAQAARCGEALEQSVYEREREAGRKLSGAAALTLAEDVIAGRKPDSAHAALTRRQREVAELVAQGKSNREIAAALVISDHTAERHIENILRSLRLNSRVQIATWFLEDGSQRRQVP